MRGIFFRYVEVDVRHVHIDAIRQPGTALLEMQVPGASIKGFSTNPALSAAMPASARVRSSPQSVTRSLSASCQTRSSSKRASLSSTQPSPLLSQLCSFATPSPLFRPPKRSWMLSMRPLPLLSTASSPSCALTQAERMAVALPHRHSVPASGFSRRPDRRRYGCRCWSGIG